MSETSPPNQSEPLFPPGVESSSPAVSPVSLSRKPGRSGARKMTVTSGRKCLGLFKRSDPIGLLVRMLLASSRWHSTIVSLTWRISATPCGRLLYRLVPVMRRTAGIGSGFLLTLPLSECQDDRSDPDSEEGKLPSLWLTPSATAIPPRSEEALKRRQRYRESIGRTTTPPGSLAEQVAYGQGVAEMMPDKDGLWATPNTMDGLPPRPQESVARQFSTNRKGRTTATVNLREQVVMGKKPTAEDVGAGKFWQTPKPSDVQGSCKGKHIWGLTAQVKLMPTVRARDYLGKTQRGVYAPGDALPNHVAVHPAPGQTNTMEAAKERKAAQLNPDWVSRMMGYPDGWLSLPLPTRKCVICGASFEALHDKQTTCSRPCLHLHRFRTSRRWRKKMLSRVGCEGFDVVGVQSGRQASQESQPTSQSELAS